MHGKKFNELKTQTMKKYFVFLASAALLLAASCNKEEVNAVGEKELITVDINPMTKTSLSGSQTVWTDGDAVSVTVGGKNIGTLTLVEGNTFSGEIEAGHDGEAVLNYPAGVTEVPATQAAVENSFANGAALLEGTATLDNLRAGQGAQLSNKTALLQFSVAIAGDVTFQVGGANYTVTGCETGKTYYACVAPAAGVSFIARINGYLSKQAASNKTFTVNQIAPIGELPAPEKFGWGLVGQHQGWNITLPTPMYKVSDKAYGVLNIKLQSNGFKFAKNGLSNWNTNNTYFGAWKDSGSGYFNYSTEMGVGAWYGVYTNNLGGQSENIGVSDFNKSYDVYVKIIQDADWGQELGYTVVEHGTKVTF